MKVPVTIITGYLGAGKTTLLRRIVDETSKKIAILMNEFGRIAIDSRIVEGKSIRMAELAGGCVCCSLSGEFEAAVAEILEKVKPEWIVVETTGVAEPAALAHDILENISGVRLDAIVTVVDCDSLVRFPSLGHTGREQIELADALVLNKIDLIDDKALEGVKGGVARINPRALMIETVNCEFETEILFGVERNKPAPLHKIHKIEFEYFDFVSDRRFDREKVLAALSSLPPEIYRCKGFFATSDAGFLVNYVAGRFSVEDYDCYETELVFIGKGALGRKAEVVASLERCII